MEIRTQEDLDQLDQEIKTKLGVDVSKYNNQEVVEHFVALLVFPQYIIKWMLGPVLLALFAFVIGFFVLDLVFIEYLIYAGVGFGLFLAVGVSAGLLFLTWKIKTDMAGVVNYSLDIMKSAITDLKQVNHQAQTQDRSEVLGLLFNGIIHIVTIPMLSQVISNKIPFIGGFVNGLMKKLFTTISNKVKFEDKLVEQELQQSSEAPRAIELYVQSISSATKGLNGVLNLTFSLTRLPLKIGTVILVLILFLFLFLIN